MKKLNDQGDYFPLWTTCLGFELIFILETGTFNFTSCEARDVPANIDFELEYPELTATSNIFGNLTKDLFTVSLFCSFYFNVIHPALQAMKNENVTYNYHKWCLRRETFEALDLNQKFKTLSRNKDVSGTEYLATVEGKNYPVFGVQYHPEKSQFEFIYRKGHLK